MLGSVAVIAGALLIKWTGWKPIDPILAVLIGLWVLPRTYVLMREAINVLLEGVPKGMDVAKVRDSLSGHAAVLDVHDLHVWALASSTPALTAHIVMRDGTDADVLRRELGGRLHDDFGIEHVTLQIEADHCGEACGEPAPAKGGEHEGHEGHDHGEDAQGHRGHVHR
ncbi:hypothetical protein G6F40_012539 [Rhizopus arrhizus]|nr:hypothetical protein G6F40_012539 [Rhizopus arrhizus]